MSYEDILRVRRTRAESEALRAESQALRRRTHDTLGRNREAVDELELRRQRNEELRGALGTWPYWAAADGELWKVLVALPGREAA